MNWETVSSGLGQKVYALWNNGRKLLTLAFSNESNFAKIEYGDEKRAFIIRYEGVFKNKMVMRNEYGVRLGQVYADSRENFISLNDEKLFYTISGEEEPRLIIYKESPDNPIADCAFTIDQEKGLLPSVRTSATTYSLLLALCWYLFSPVAKENMPEFA
ncbi:MAG: hypothetical protein JNK14_17320 [Chitinophagaceae bacterium]|nr:hypothetical protein [Chitinophagaceae bacterium]